MFFTNSMRHKLHIYKLNGGTTNVRIPSVLQNLRMPVIGSPLFIISNPKLVIEQCKAGIVGSMPALNAENLYPYLMNG